MEATYSFGEWVSQRRKAYDLTQRELAARSACAVATIKKIEADERRPSRDLAAMLAEALRVPADWQERFIECARGQSPVDGLVGMQADSGGDAETTRTSKAVRPVATTPFVGRERDLTRIADMLSQPDCRLLTLTGPGGMGKTRLAVAVARAQSENFEDGAVFVPLAPVTDAALIPVTIAQSLNLAINDRAQLLAYLRGQTLLLVLDNCEQFDEGLDWLSALLADAPGIKLLATSRERLQLAEEWVYPLLELDESPAVELFVQTARRVAPDFDLEGQHEAVMAVCQLVDTLPLAIELAAGWTPFMACEQIAEHIRGDIDFLAANVRNLPARHRSLRAVFDHSWQLLSPVEQEALMRLSVFRGGWTVDEAGPVAGATLPVLRTLMEKSLVRSLGEGRYDLHELTRQYAAERLRDSGDGYETHRAHAEAYIALTMGLHGQLVADEAQAAFATVDTEQDNFRAVLSWAVEHDEADVALRLLAELFFFWLRRGYWREAEQWLKAALAAAGDEDHKWVAIGLCNLSTFVAIQGQYNEAGPLAKRGSEIAYRVEDVRAMLTATELLTQATLDIDEAGRWFEQTVALMEDWDHPVQPLRLAGAYTLFGDRLRAAGRYEEARALFQEALARMTQIGNKYMIAYPMGNLGRVALHEGQIQEAYDLISDSVGFSRRIGNPVDIADWGWQLGHVALLVGDLLQAESCFEESLALYEEVGNQRALPDMLAFLGQVALLQDDGARAADYFRQSLRLYQDVLLRLQDPRSDWSNLPNIALIGCLMSVAVLAAEQADDVRVVTLLSHVDAARFKDGHLIEPRLQARADGALKQAQAKLSEADYAAVWEAGQAMSLAGILEDGLSVF